MKGSRPKYEQVNRRMKVEKLLAREAQSEAGNLASLCAQPLPMHATDVPVPITPLTKLGWVTKYVRFSLTADPIWHCTQCFVLPQTRHRFYAGADCAFQRCPRTADMQELRQRVALAGAVPRRFVGMVGMLSDLVLGRHCL